MTEAKSDTDTDDAPRDGAGAGAPQTPAREHAGVARAADKGVDDGDRGAERTCIATGVSAPKERLVRFVLGPGDIIAADLGAKLPGRGAYVAPSREAIARAVRKNLFARALKAPAHLPEGVDADALADHIRSALTERLAAALGLARRAGGLVVGIDKLEGEKPGRLVLVLASVDASERSRRAAMKIAAANGAAFSSSLEGERLSAAIGLDGVRFAGVRAGPTAERAIAEGARLGGFVAGGFIPVGAACTVAGDDGADGTAPHRDEVGQS